MVLTGDDHGHGGTAGQFNQLRGGQPDRLLGRRLGVRALDLLRLPGHAADQRPGRRLPGGRLRDRAAPVRHGFADCNNFTSAAARTQPHEPAAAVRPVMAERGGAGHAAARTASCGATGRRAPSVELAHGIRLDTNYYYWPGTWVQDRPGFFTGSGFPMRFAAIDGSPIDVYQAATQLTDESGQTIPTEIKALLDKALGTEGYYGVITANMHTDQRR